MLRVFFLFVLAALASCPLEASQPFNVDGIEAKSSVLSDVQQTDFPCAEFEVQSKSSRKSVLEIDGVSLINRNFYRKSIALRPGESGTLKVFAPYVDGGRNELRASDDAGREVWRQAPTGWRQNIFEGDPWPEPWQKPLWRDLCGVEALVLTPGQWSELSTAKREAILDWTWLGGELLLSGGSHEDLKKIETQAPPANFSTAAALNGNERYGRGWMSAVPAATPSKTRCDNRPLRNVLRNGLPQLEPSWAVRQIAPVPFVAATVLFGLLAGPLIIFLTQKKGRPALALILIPALSLLACAAIALAAFLGDGISPKLCKQSISYLDQKSGKACTQEIFGVEAPIGLFKAPQLPEEALVSARMESLNGGRFIAADGKLNLVGMVLPRTPFLIEAAKFERRKERLAVSESLKRLIAKNEFGAVISNLKLRDSNGLYWVHEGTIEPDAETPLVRAEAGVGTCYAGFQSLRLSDASLKKEEPLAPGCYQAELASDVFGDAFVSGARQTGDNFHIVVGRY